MGAPHGALCRARGDVVAGNAAAVKRTAPCCPRGAASLGIADQFAVPYRNHMGANRSNGEAVIGCWKPEQALVARPFCTVEVRRLPPGDYALGLAGRRDDRGCRRSGLFSRTKLRLRRKRETAC